MPSLFDKTNSYLKQFENASVVDKDDLIQQLRAALSWELAHKADNPALQAILEHDREADPLHQRLSC
jgi:hypothetical protein